MAEQADIGTEPPKFVQRQLLNDLPMLPAAASKALQLTRDPNCSTTEFAGVVECDIKLATEVLVMANTPIFGGGQAISNLGQAIVRLGFRQCRNLILTTSASSLIQKLPVETARIRELISQHGFTTAASCRHLNQLLDLGFQGEEFTSGLLHDFGRILLAMVDYERFEHSNLHSLQEPHDVLEQERSVFSTDHCQLGAWFASYSGLPDELHDPILNHHRLDLGTDLDTLTLLTAAGDHVANFIELTGGQADYDASENQAICLLEQKLGQNFQEPVSESASNLMECVLSDLGASKTTLATSSENPSRSVKN